MEASKVPKSIIAIYFSKENIGVSHFDKEENKIECGLIQFWTYCSREKIGHIIEQRSAQMILTNNSKHAFLSNYAESIRIGSVDERGLQDDVIENNISVLKLNPIKQTISNKLQFIKLMREHSESCGLNKEKYKSLGILLYYLLNQNEYSLTNHIYLNDICYFFDLIFKHTQITNSQLEALQIIKQEVHPSFIKGKGRSKEGFSVLSLYQAPLSSAGSKKVLRNIFRNPTYNKKTIQQRLDLINWIKKFSNDYKSLLKIFRSIHSVDIILNKFLDSRVEDEDWKKLIRTIQSMIILHKILQEKVRANEVEMPRILIQFFEQVNWTEMARIVSTVTSTLDIAQGTIRRGVDQQLDQMKKVYDNLPHLLTLYARQQNWSDDFRIVFMAQIGYLIRVPHEVQIPQEFQQQKWSLQFVKNSGKFYCNELTKTLDEQYGDIYGQITDREKKINFQLENIVSEASEIIQLAYWKSCEIECFVGVSIVSNGMCKPRLSSESLIISRGWHLLLAQDAIDNHAFSFNQSEAPRGKVFNSEENLVNTNYSNRMVLISGPNGSGKTIYMKQVTIMMYLTHLGFFVPAEFAEVPLVDKFILVESKRSIYRGNNGFQSQIASLSRVMTPGMFTNKSVILIDELGASIDTILAKKMLIALLQFLTQPNLYSITKNECLQKVTDRFEIPLTIAITHLTDIMSDSIVEQSYNLRYLTMDMQRQQICLFKIKPGLVRKGYGIQCARGFMNGDFIKRAEQFWHDIKYRS